MRTTAESTTAGPEAAAPNVAPTPVAPASPAPTPPAPASPAPTPAGWLAEGFAAHAVRWATEGGAPAAAIAAIGPAARQVSVATAEGHVCVPLAALSQAPAELRGLLLASGIVGTPDAPGARPLILDSQDRLYLHRYFDYERRLARRLTSAQAHARPDPVARPQPEPAAKALLQRLYADNAARLGGRPDWQKIATALALDGRLTIVSGGPGTGKTATVVNLLACLLAENPDCRIALAAPTGKAAARMLEAIRLRATQLPPEIGIALPNAAHTIHRLLGATPRGFRHDAAHRLALDALIVDEASMLDLALATRLFEAVPDHARIVLLGDKDQLAAVEAGAVFAELGADPGLSAACRARLAAWCELPVEAIAAPADAVGAPADAVGASVDALAAPADANAAPAEAGFSALPDSTVWLRENYRFAADTGIGQLAAEIRAGRADAALDRLRNPTDPSLAWLDDAQPVPDEATLQHLVAGYTDYLEALRRNPGDAAAVSLAFGRFRVLCAVRAGPRGVEAVNRLVERHLRQALAGAAGTASPAAVPGPTVMSDARSPWYAGRPVLVLRNDPLLQLYNGDIGIALPDAQGRLMVWFGGGEGGLRPVAPLRLPPHQTAYAMTVHKAQGSEFDAVALLLPAEPHRVASRELLYTALTRARTRATLIGNAAVLRQAIETPTERHSGLLARLRETHAP